MHKLFFVPQDNKIIAISLVKLFRKKKLEASSIYRIDLY